MSAARHATFRLVLRRVLGSLDTTLPVPLIYLVGALLWIKLGDPPAETRALLWWGLGALGAVPLLAALWALTRQRPALWGAQALDRFHDLEGRISNALAFQGQTRAPLMQASIEDALRFADRLRPRRAVPLRPPGGVWVSLALLAGVAALAQLELRSSRFVPAPPLASVVPLELPQDDVELLRELSEQLQASAQDPTVLAAMRRFNQLVEDIADRRLDREEVFRRLEEVERGLADEQALDQESLSEALSGLGRELQKSRLTRPAAEALEQKNLKDAEEALRQLAERLKNQPKSIDKAELDRLRQALSRASQQNADRQARLEKQRQELSTQRERLLQKKQKGQALTAGEQRELDQSERQLKRLDRQKRQADRGSQELSKLDRELAEAARKLMEEMGGSEAAKHLEQGAQDLNRMAKKQLSDQEKEQLKKQLEELREMLRQNKGDNKKRQEMLERFRRSARGQQKSGDDTPGGPGKGGKGKPGQSRPGPGGAGASIEIPIPVPGEAAGSAAGPGQGVGEGAGSAPAPLETGKHDPLAGKVHDVSAAGIDSGQGEAASEVVYGASERGFSGGGYRKVFTDYKTVAEEALETDEIPAGYKFYVRRYFQLIRPRE